MRKLELATVKSVCEPLATLITQERAVVGRGVELPVDLDELEGLTLASTASKDTVKWRDRLMTNLRRAAADSQVSSQAGLNTSLPAVVAAVQGLQEAQKVAEVAVAAPSASRIDYTQPPALECQVDCSDMSHMFASGGNLFATTRRRNESYSVDIAAQTLTPLKEMGVATALNDGTLISMPTSRQLVLSANGTVSRTLTLPNDVKSVAALHAGGFVACLHDGVIMHHDARGECLGAWSLGNEVNEMIVLSDDSIAAIRRSPEGKEVLDVLDVTTGDAKRSWAAEGPQSVMQYLVELSDGRLQVKTFDWDTKTKATRVIAANGVATSLEATDIFRVCALQDGHTATIYDQELAIRDSLGNVVNRLAFGDASYDHRYPTLLALPDGRLVVGNRYIEKILVFRFPETNAPSTVGAPSVAPRVDSTETELQAGVDFATWFNAGRPAIGVGK